MSTPTLNTAGVQFFQLEYGQGLNPTQWFTLGAQQTDFAEDRPVGTWDTSGLDGLYSLRLVVVLDDNTRESDAIQVTIDNVPPNVTLTSVEPGKIYRWPGDDSRLAASAGAGQSDRQPRRVLPE